MSKFLKKCVHMLAGVLAATMVFGNVSFAVNDTKQQQQQKAQAKVQNELYKAIKKVEKHVQRNDDGTFTIEGNPDVKADYLSDIKTNMEEINQLIKSGVLETDSNLRVYADKKYILKGNLKTNKTDYVEYDTFFKNNQPEINNLNIPLGNQTVSLNLNGNAAYADSYRPPVGLYYYWWGAQLSLDENTTQGVIKALNWGAGAAGLIGALQLRE